MPVYGDIFPFKTITVHIDIKTGNSLKALAFPQAWLRSNPVLVKALCLGLDSPQVGKGTDRTNMALNTAVGWAGCARTGTLLFSLSCSCPTFQPSEQELS